MENMVGAKFVSQKVNKIRWMHYNSNQFKQCDTFATGSWDNSENTLSIWSLEREECGNTEQTMYVPKGEPVMLCEAPHIGDVTGMRLLDAENLLTASSSGHAAVYRHQINDQEQHIRKTQEWAGIHHSLGQPCAATGVAVQGSEFVTVGEDGRLNVMSVHQKTPVISIEESDSCTTNAVCFLKHSDVATVNSTGQLKVWDLRASQMSRPQKVFLLAGERVPLNCVDKHPSQPHIVATGGQDSTLCIWDMRQDRFPVTLLTAHTADMWEVVFHPSLPDNLFTCSEDGTVWHWDGSSVSCGYPVGKSSLLSTSLAASETGVTSPWLSSEASKHRLEVTDILPENTMPVNSIDIVDNTLLCGTDGEQIYTISNMMIK